MTGITQAGRSQSIAHGDHVALERHGDQEHGEHAQGNEMNEPIT